MLEINMHFQISYAWHTTKRFSNAKGLTLRVDKLQYTDQARWVVVGHLQHKED
jgi:hypothetical protein